MSLQKRRRELEKHLQEPPTQERFQTILNLLKEMEEDFNESPSAEGTQKLDEILAYTSEVLETWDDSLRHASIWSVSQNSFTFQVTKAFALLHSLDSVYDDTHYHSEAYRKMWGEHNIKVLSYTPSSLTSLTLDGGCNDVNEIKVLLTSPLIKQLKALNFQRRKPKTEVLKLIFLCEEASVEVRRQMLTMMPDVALRDLAKTFQIPGRSKMSRETLQDSLKECINSHQEAHAPHDTISAPPSQIAALRGLLSRPPSGMGFLRIIDLLEDWQAHQHQQDTFLYAQQHLASWPSHFCRKPGTSDLNHHFERWPFSLNGPAAVLSRSAGVSLPLEEKDNTFSKAFQEDHSLASFTDLRFMFSGSAGYHREGSETVLREVLDAEQLQGLTSLGIEEMPFMEYPEEALLSSTLLKNLDTLSLCNVDFDLQIIVESPHFSSIQSFHVSLDLKEHEVEALIHSPHCKQLTSLGLPHSRIAPEGLQTLLEDAHWPALTSLCLDNTPFDDTMAAVLAESPLLSQLTHLLLRAHRTDK